MFGSHLSVAGGLANALREAERLDMDTVQVFTKNQRQWRVPPLDPAVAADWLAELDRLGWRSRTVSHASYLINMASPDKDLRAKSIALMGEEIDRCEALSIPFLVFHPGAHMGDGAEAGIGRIADACASLLRDRPDGAAVLCFENTVGAGSHLGRTFEELAQLRSLAIDAGAPPDRLGFCFDTCHALAAGYDVAAADKMAAVLDQFDNLCGIDHLRVVHMNDSKTPLASRRDRHEHIGKGHVKTGGFAGAVNHPALRGVPKILETPKGKDARGTDLDTVNLRRLRKLVSTKPAARR